jgi:membrane protein DedA with SNARE-associated domain
MIAEILSDTITQFILSIGYPGVFILNAFMPAPLEVVMLFSGYLAYLGKFNLISVVFVGTAGCTTSSAIAYALGLKGGRPFLEKYGKYLMLKRIHLVLAERWFTKHGDRAVFFSRMLPLLHVLVSFPAGIGRYDFRKLVLYSFLGYLIWCSVLTYTGFLLGPYWRNILGFFNGLDTAMIIILILAAVYFLKFKS